MYKIYTKILRWPFCAVLNKQLDRLTDLLMPCALIKKQIIMNIKITTILLMVAIVQVSAAGFAQRVTYQQKKVSIAQIFKAVKQQTGYGIVWPAAAMRKLKPVDVNFKNATLEEVLESCLKDQPFSYTINEKVIVIKERQKSVLDKVTDFFQGSSRLDIDVKGRVVDENGKPLKGATVRVTDSEGEKNTVKIQVTLTDASGGFILKQVNENVMLSISFIGYETTRIPAAKDLGAIRLKVSAAKLEEIAIVSTGYQQIDKSKMTGSSATIKAKDLTINGTVTIEQMLQGKLPGVEVVNNSGMVGKRQTVRVRGTSTLLGNQEPVWVVDGIIQEDPLPFKATELNAFNQDPSNADALKNFIGSAISWLNPYDIEDITVLKDAASTAIYGVKAANGVIVINTKRGKTGRAPSINYSTSFSTQQGLSYDKMNLMNSKERVDVSREIWQRGLSLSRDLDEVGYSGLLKDYLFNKLSYDEFNAGAKQLEVNNTNWFDLLYDTPLSQNHNLSVSGGGTGSTYYGSFGYNNQKGGAKGNGMNSYSGSINFTSYLTDKLSVSARLSGNYSNTTAFFNIDPYGYAMKTSRVIPAFNPDGSLSYYRNGSFKYNILNEIANSGNDNVKTNLNTAINIKYELPFGFRFESSLGVAYTNSHAESYASELTNRITAKRGFEYGQFGPTANEYKMSQLPIGGELAEAEDRNSNFTFRNAINYGHVFNEKHAVSAMLGLELRSNVSKGTSSTVFGYLPDRGKAIALPPATTTNNGVTNANIIYDSGFKFAKTDRTANYVSYYFTGAYTYDNRYVLSLSVRGDASNRFGQDTRNKFNPIWALGGRWNVAREHFFDKTSWFNDFSVRGSYGYQGNVAENYGPDLIARIPTGGGSNTISPLTGEPILNIKSLPYGDLRWEKTNTVNLGLDFSFFKSRIMASLDYYNKKSTDLIILKDIPYENGVKQMPMNGGTLTNSGFEASLTVIPVRTQDLNWSVTVNSSKNYNKVTNKLLPNPTWNNAISGNYFVDGFPVSAFWVFDYKGPDAATGVPTFNIPTTAQDPNAKFDAVAFMKYAGKMNADFTAGFNTSVRYKQLTFGVNLYASLGGYKLLSPLFSQDMENSAPNEYNNLSKDLVNRWRKPGDEAFTNIPGLPYKGVPFVTIPSGTQSLQSPSSSPYTLYNYSTARLVKASYLRINNVTVNYVVPQQFAKRLRMNNLSIGYTISNLHTFVSKDFKGVDPEVASGTQPLPLTHIMNLSVTF